MISFFVSGRPITQGSMKLVRGHMIHNKHRELIAWRDAVRAEAMPRAPRKPTPRPVVVSAAFYLARPKSHLARDGSVRTRYRDAIPPLDLDKLQRAIGDALSGLVYEDDKQIVCWRYVVKRWCDDACTSSEGAMIEVHVADAEREGVSVRLEAISDSVEAG